MAIFEVLFHDHFKIPNSLCDKYSLDVMKWIQFGPACTSLQIRFELIFLIDWWL